MLIDSKWLSPIPNFVTLYTGHLEKSSLLSYADLSNVGTSHDTQSILNALMSMLTSSKQTNKQASMQEHHWDSHQVQRGRQKFSKSLIFTWELELYYC